MSLQKAAAAVKANPRNPDAWAALGDAFALANNVEKARKSYLEALNIDPQHEAALAGLTRLDQAAPPPAWLDNIEKPIATAPGSPAPVAPWLQSATAQTPPAPTQQQRRPAAPPAPATAPPPGCAARLSGWLGQSANWWWRTFQAQGCLGRGIFLGASLFGACCVCSVPSAIFSPTRQTPPQVATRPTTTTITEATAPPTTAEPKATTIYDATAQAVLATPGPATPTAPLPTATAEPVVLASSQVNLRTGPGTAYPVATTIQKDTRVPARAISPDGAWIQVVLPGGSGWVSADMVRLENGDGLPVAQNIAPPPTPTRQAPPAVPAQPQPPRGARACNTFGTHAEAQAYFEAAGRPSQMDRDKDGIACEELLP